jgi:hypothetical protein
MSQIEQEKDQSEETPELLAATSGAEQIEAGKPQSKQTSVAKSAGIISIVQ